MARHCKFQHPALEDRQDRCWLCSGKDHQKADCPHRGSGEQSGGSDHANGAGGAGLGATEARDHGFNNAKGNGKNKKGLGKGSKGKPAKEEQAEKGRTATVASASATAPTTEQEQQSKEALPKAAVKAAAVQDPGTGELVSEVASFLRSLRTGDPKIRVCYIKKVSDAKDGSVLLDDGATHCLRQAKDEDEWNRAKEITVHLATGQIQLRQDQESGVVQTKEATDDHSNVSLDGRGLCLEVG